MKKLPYVALGFALYIGIIVRLFTWLSQYDEIALEAGSSSWTEVIVTFGCVITLILYILFVIISSLLQRKIIFNTLAKSATGYYLGSLVVFTCYITNGTSLVLVIFAWMILFFGLFFYFVSHIARRVKIS